MLPPLSESAATSVEAAAFALGIMEEFTNMEEWIEIWQNGRILYYWNHSTGKTPQCYVPFRLTVTWAGAQDKFSGQYYFWQLGNPSIESVWQLPPLRESTAMAPGAAALASGRSSGL